MPTSLKIPIVLDIDDLDTSVLKGRINCLNIPKWERLLYKRQLKQIQPTVFLRWHQANHLLLAKSNDINALPKECRSRTTVLKNIPFYSKIPNNSIENSSANILCVTTWNNSGNRIGLLNFLNESWPKIKQNAPNSTLTICGTGATQRIRTIIEKIDGVIYKGFVSDLNSEYENSLFCIAPIAFGAGSNIKILEAFQYGRTCIASPKAAHAFDEFFSHDIHLLIADTPNRFTEYCLSLLKKPHTAHSLGSNARQALNTHFSRDMFFKQIKDTVKQVANKNLGNE
ncbi:glycosyltransferase family 4 protein [Puniceicoccaceae bacterium K14]|nr:glycosyltransferase family 4 protein [Puniceicoccaceae bacterium K14]